MSCSPNTRPQTRTLFIMKRILDSHLVPLPLSGPSEKHATPSPSRLFMSCLCSGIRHTPLPRPNTPRHRYSPQDQQARTPDWPPALAGPRQSRQVLFRCGLTHCQHTHSFTDERTTQRPLSTKLHCIGVSNSLSHSRFLDSACAVKVSSSESDYQGCKHEMSRVGRDTFNMLVDLSSCWSAARMSSTGRVLSCGWEKSWGLPLTTWCGLAVWVE